MRRLIVALTSLLTVAASATTAEAAPAVTELGGGSTLFHIGDPSGAPCTAAFAATDSSGSPVLLAAGSGCSGTLYSGSGVVEVGPVVASLPGDLAIVQVADPADWTLVPWVGDGVTITGSADPVVGGGVCLIEADGVAGCGTVEAVDISVDFPEGVVDHVAVTDVHADPSGHAVTFVSGSSIEGVLIGADTVSSYFEPAGQILSAYGLQLLV